MPETYVPLRRATLLSAIVILAAIVLNASAASAQPSAPSFAVLGGPAVTCTTSTVTGDLGVVLSTGFTNTGCVVVGAVHAGDSAAAMGYADFLSTYNDLAVNPPCTATLSGTLAGVTLPPGVYCFPAAATLTGTLFLDAQFDPNAVWIFRVGTLAPGDLTGTNFDVLMINGGEPCNVSWWVRDGATLTDSKFLGDILAGADITVTTSTIHGNVLAKGAVTLTGSTASGCAASNGGGDGGGGGGKKHAKCNQGVGNGPESCDPGNSNHRHPSNDERGGTPGNPGRKPGNR